MTRFGTRGVPVRHLSVGFILVAAGICVSTVAAAQPAPKRAPRPPTAGAGVAAAPGVPAPNAGAPNAAAPQPDMMAATPGGVTAEQVGARAAQTSYQAKAAEQTVTSYEERTSAAEANYLPRVGLKASYTRLSD